MSAAPIRVLYFAWLRERIGRGEEVFALPPGVATVGALRDWLAARDAAHGEAFAGGTAIRCAVNQDMAGPDAPVGPGDEIAFFPPVTGG